MVLKNKTKIITISLDMNLLKFIDEERGLIKRSTYIRYLLGKQILPMLKQRAEITNTPPSKEDINEV